ncbi:MAG: Chemotaxis protein methyltransferase CheR [Nitrospira sp.]|nr:MAG: Chemotaxis protein methyltransferase CheR [Nitrospira sp.]
MNRPDMIESRPDAPPSRAKVLLVDDHPVNLMALAELLRRDDVELLHAESGAEALELLLVHDVALALIDVQMPEMDGFELAELMRGVERAKYVPIIFVTAGMRDAERRFRGYEAGAVDLLYKPIETDILKSKVNVFLAIDRQRRELTRLLAERTEAERQARESEAKLQSLASRLERTVEERTEALVESQERLRALAVELNLAEQRERARLATDMHDHLQQLLVLGKLKLAGGKRASVGLPAVEKMIHETDEIFAEALQYTRSLVAELSPPVLRDHGLGAGLRWLSGYYTEKYGMTVTVTMPKAVEPTLLSEDQSVLLFQSVRELLMNAWKHAGTTEAAVVLEQTGDRLRITVSDQGAGFDCAAVAVAEPAGGLSSKFGLFSIKERMRSLGGSLELESAPGKGTIATITLPLRSGAESSGTAAHVRAEHSALRTQHSGPQQNAKIRVLLVDDHAMVRQGIRAVLEGYEDVQIVGEAVDGQDAVRLAEQLRPGIVVMDINMPKMNGIEATQEITARYPNIIVIGLSVNADDDNYRAMTRAGAATLLTKEAAVEQIYETMLAILKDFCPVA